MDRRDVLKAAVAVPFLTDLPLGLAATAAAASSNAAHLSVRVRPTDPAWPDAAAWGALGHAVGGRLLPLASPFAGCADTPQGTDCAATLRHADNPFWLGDQPALTQASGWADAWRSQPSAYAVAAENTADIVAAVDFARTHRLRLVVKGGGHSYQGTSSAPDSLLVWTRRMNDVVVHEAFVAQGCSAAAQPAVTLGSGAMWIDAYHAVTTRGGRYVQGGGCTTVGVAGLVQSGGFSNFSKNFGTAAAGLLEAEIVTADGQVRIANACTNPDLFWALKGGGGGSLGVISRLTLRTRELPDTFGAVFGTIKATTDDAYRALIARLVAFYATTLFNPHWGEQITLGADNTVHLSLVFQGLTKAGADHAWSPVREWIASQQGSIVEVKPIQILALPARHFWDVDFLQKNAPGVMVPDDRPGAPPHHAEWAGDQDQASMFIHGYSSMWLPASLLRPSDQPQLVDALFAATRHFSVGLHFNKGLAGAPRAEIAAARDTATHPDVLDAFALAIISTGGPSAYPGVASKPVDLSVARDNAAKIGDATAALRKAAPRAGSYVSESDFFQRDWQTAFWGTNYRRLARVKERYDPDGLFFVHHGVGSEEWSADGFTRRTSR